MSTISASTTTTTAYKVTADTTGTLVLQTGSTPTTAVTIGTDQSVTTAGTINGLTVGRGAGAVSTNTAVGASALSTNSTGGVTTAVGFEAAKVATAGDLDAFGYQALKANTTGTANSAFGTIALTANTTGVANIAVGRAALNVNTTGSYNTAVGRSALEANTTASNNTAVGYQAGYTNSTGTYSTFFGTQAGYNNTGSSNVFLGAQAGYNGASSGGFNTVVGAFSGYYLTTGQGNTFIGTAGSGSGVGCGSYVTTGSKNTILGGYNGNQGGLDIRTASNKVVLSDGDGNPVFVYGAYPYPGGTYLTNSSGYATLGRGGTGSTGTGALFLSGEASSGWGPVVSGYANSTNVWTIGSYSWIKGGTNYENFTVVSGAANVGGVYLTSGGTSWASASDERLKDIIEPISNGLNKVASLRAVIGKYKNDAEEKRRPFLIAQDVQAVLPEAVVEGRNSKDDDTEYLQLAYTDVIPLLVAAIKELKAEFDAYKEAHP